MRDSKRKEESWTRKMNRALPKQNELFPMTDAFSCGEEHRARQNQKNMRTSDHEKSNTKLTL